MPDIQIIQQKSIGFTEHGDSVYSTESFVKVAVSFKSGSLRLLKGAPLSVFMCLALHEADSDPGASLSMVETETGYSSPTVIQAIRFLCDPAHHFIDEVGAEADGTKRYRVSAYAWFGNGGKRGGGKVFLPPKTVQKTFSSVVDSCINKQPVLEKEQQQQLFCAETKKFFHAAGIGEPALSALAKTVAADRAEMWVDWLSDPPASFKRPEAYLVKRLSADPQSDPPGWTIALWEHWRAEDEREEQERQREAETRAAVAAVEPTAPQPSLYRADGTADLWDRALGELKLQMTKATFDTWVRGSRALGWDDATGDLVIAVHSPYAKEWIEARLRATVARTVSGIAEREIAVRYEYQVNNGPAH